MIGDDAAEDNYYQTDVEGVSNLMVATQREQNNFIDLITSIDNNRSTLTNKLVNQKPFILMTLLFPPGNRVAMTETMALSGNKYNITPECHGKTLLFILTIIILTCLRFGLCRWIATKWLASKKNKYL